MSGQRYATLWSRRSIVSLIGIDYSILEKSGYDNTKKFYIAGSLVIAILVLSFCSVFYAFDLMFDMWHAEILLSSFFSLMFFTIYIFLMQTFSKEVFPTKYKIRFFNLSNLSRIGFVLMIGILIAQPIKILLFKERLDRDILIYKDHLKQKFVSRNDSLYVSDLKKLNSYKAILQKMPESESILAEVHQTDQCIEKINNDIAKANIKAEKNISSSNFFVKRILIAGNYPGSSIAVILIMGLLFTPIALIYSISGKSKYYNLKKNNDRNLVIKDYLKFKAKYSQIFERKFNLPGIRFHEPFLDPPFNTTAKNPVDYLSQEDFLNHFNK